MRRRYKIIVEDESRLTKLAVFRTNVWLFSLMTVVIVACLLAGAVAIVMLTPLRTLLPGYMKEEQRDYSMATLAQLDSLQRNYDINQRYLANLMEVLDTDRVPTQDSTITANRTHSYPLDSLRDASQREKNFVSSMQDKESFNISVLAPLAAEGIEIAPISAGSVFEDATKYSTTARVVISGTSPICSVTEGRVAEVACQMSSGTYSVLVLHNKGFATRYSGIGYPLVVVGQEVGTGQAIGEPSHRSGRATNVINVQMWRNAVPLMPAQFLNRPVAVENASAPEPVVDEDVGRGK